MDRSLLGLYFFAIIEISKVTKGIPDLPEVIGFTLFLIAGCFLNYGVYVQMSTMRRWYKQLFSDYKNMVEHSAYVVVSKIPDMRHIGREDQDVKNLNDSLREFESKYFPKNKETE